MVFPKSISSLLLGILKRLYYLIPSLFTDPFDFLEGWLKISYEPPQWLFWLLLVFGLAIAFISAYHEVRMQKIRLEKQLNDKSKRKEIRETLGRFLIEGNKLRSQCSNEKEPPPEKEIEEFATRMETYVLQNLGDAYVARIASSAGLPVGFTSIASNQHRNLWASLGVWMARINEIISEFRD